MNKLLDNILKIHEIMSTADNFFFIRQNIESLDKNHNYKKLVEDTNMLIEVLNAFSKSHSGK